MSLGCTDERLTQEVMTRPVFCFRIQSKIRVGIAMGDSNLGVFTATMTTKLRTRIDFGTAMDTTGQNKLEQKNFDCTCAGENPECIHCNGSGHTTKQMVRSSRTLSLDRPSSEPYRSKKERLYDLQVNREMPHLRSQFESSSTNESDVFVKYLKRLLASLLGSDTWFWDEVQTDKQLGLLAREFKCRENSSSEVVRIFAKATATCWVTFNKSQPKRKRLPVGKAFQKDPRPDTSLSQRVLCSKCGAMVYSIDQHFQLFHPSTTANRPSTITGRMPLSQSANKATSTGATGKNYSAGKGKSEPISWALFSDKARTDTSNIERAMDARCAWGGRFRDTNGSFGSYPLHDSMDDESGPN